MTCWRAGNCRARTQNILVPRWSLHCLESGCLIYTFCFMETAGKSALQKQAASLWGTHPIILTLNLERFLKHNLPLIVSSMWAVIFCVQVWVCMCNDVIYMPSGHLHICILGKELNKTWVILFKGMWESQRIFTNVLKSLRINQSSINKCFLMPRYVPSTKIKAVRGTMRHGKESSHIPQQPWKAPVWIKDNH